MNWTSSTTPPPLSEDPADNYGAWIVSKPVLTIDKRGRMTVACYRKWEDEEDEYEPQWVESGRDAYTLDDITHWTPLPDPPATTA